MSDPLGPTAPNPTPLQEPESQPAGDPSNDIASGTGCVVALKFREPLMAQEALLAAVRLRAAKRLDLEDAAIVAKGTDGKVRIQQTADLNAVQGASGGLWLGVLAGLFVPGGVLIGGALGAALGGLWGKLRDIGIADARMKELGDALPAGQAALFLLISGAHRYHAMAELRRFPAELFYASVGEQDRAEIVAALASGAVDEGY